MTLCKQFAAETCLSVHDVACTYIQSKPPNFRSQNPVVAFTMLWYSIYRHLCYIKMPGPALLHPLSWYMYKIVATPTLNESLYQYRDYDEKITPNFLYILTKEKNFAKNNITPLAMVRLLRCSDEERYLFADHFNPKKSIKIPKYTTTTSVFTLYT